MFKQVIHAVYFFRTVQRYCMIPLFRGFWCQSVTQSKFSHVLTRRQIGYQLVSSMTLLHPSMSSYSLFSVTTSISFPLLLRLSSTPCFHLLPGLLRGHFPLGIQSIDFFAYRSPILVTRLNHLNIVLSTSSNTDLTPKSSYSYIPPPVLSFLLL